MRRLMLVVFFVLFASTLAVSADSGPLLLQNPTLSKTQIAFNFGGDIWIVDRDGGDAQRLVTGTGTLSRPIFSPDGTEIAYTGNYDGNDDVYVVAATGGEPRRLTFHPGSDVAVGWTNDGKSILFRTTRSSYSRFEMLYTTPATGGYPTPLPLPMGVEGAYSPDGTHLAYVPGWNRRLGAVDAYVAIKHYRGGHTALIWIANLADSSITRIPREGSNDFDPMWIGDRIYFLSDRDGPVTLFSFDTKTQQAKALFKNDGFDLESASAGPGGIVYEQFGSIHIYDLHTGKSREVSIRVAGDMPQIQPRFEKIDSRQLMNAHISPTGARAVFEAHGEIITVPAEKGDVRNLTNTPGVAERDPAWSPDGKSIAYFSDESGEYALHIRDQSGLGAAKKIDLGKPPSFFYAPVWSPDSKKIAYNDKRLNLWYVDVDHPTPVKVSMDRFDTPLQEFDVQWSPDSKWLTYTLQLENHMRGVFVYSLDSQKATQVTDGMSDAVFPAFDKNGKYLYFTASTNMGLTTGWLDMTSEAHPVTRSVYVVVLKKDLPSPLAPESDEEKPAAKKDDDSGKSSAKDDMAKSKEADKKAEAVKVQIDFDGLSQRILALPIPARNYFGLSAGKEGVLYLVEGPQVEGEGGPNHMSLQKFDLKTRKVEQIIGNAEAFDLSFNGEKMLYRQGEHWFINPAEKPPEAGKGILNTGSVEVYVVPREEWKQMFHEVWRIERDFFYDPHFHGLDIQKAEQAYAPFVDGLTSRADFNYLLADMLGNVNVLHMFVAGGKHPDIPNVDVGLLGADYTIDNGRYRFAHVFSGENWNPHLHAPLTEPGVNVKEGEYLLAVNGRDLTASDEIYSYFQETGGKQAVLKVGPHADGSGSREVTVVPVDDEGGLRNLAWIEGNRRKVDDLSGGKLAYVYLPNTAGAGFTNFNRYYFAQVGKKGAVIDERFNGGGQLADYIIDYLHRPVMSQVLTREGEPSSEPEEAIFGPKAMIINEYAGSGGDAMPWYFRKAGIGPLVGTRTWGGLVGIGGYPRLIDGGAITAPRWAIYGLKGQWEVENHGIAPDVEVELDPKLVREGHDPQLERAVQVVLDELKKHPIPTYPKPAYPNYHDTLPMPVR